MDSSQTTFKQLNAPFWTLAIEWQYYMFLPLVVLGMRLLVWRMRQGYRLPATVACILAVITWGLFSRYIGVYFLDQHPTETFLLPRPVLNVVLFFTYGVSGKYYEDFGVGMLLSLCFIYAHHPSGSPRLRAALQRLSLWFWAAGLGCLLTLVLWSYNWNYPNTWPFFNNERHITSFYLVNQLCISLSFGLCILALLFGSAWLRRPFEWPQTRWVGMISYSLYMWHLPFLLLFIQWVQPLLSGWSPEQAYGMYWLWVLLVIIPFCFLFFRWIEQPGMKLGERFVGRRTKTAPSAGTLSPSLHEGPAIEQERHKPLQKGA